MHPFREPREPGYFILWLYVAIVCLTGIGGYTVLIHWMKSHGV
jgi:hypothetical protein